MLNSYTYLDIFCRYFEKSKISRMSNLKSILKDLDQKKVKEDTLNIESENKRNHLKFYTFQQLSKNNYKLEKKTTNIWSLLKSILLADVEKYKYDYFPGLISALNEILPLLSTNPNTVATRCTEIRNLALKAVGNNTNSRIYKLFRDGINCEEATIKKNAQTAKKVKEATTTNIKLSDILKLKIKLEKMISKYKDDELPNNDEITTRISLLVLLTGSRPIELINKKFKFERYKDESIRNTYIRQTGLAKARITKDIKSERKREELYDEYDNKVRKIFLLFGTMPNELTDMIKKLRSRLKKNKGFSEKEMESEKSKYVLDHYNTTSTFRMILDDLKIEGLKEKKLKIYDLRAIHVMLAYHFDTEQSKNLSLANYANKYLVHVSLESTLHYITKIKVIFDNVGLNEVKQEDKAAAKQEAKQEQKEAKYGNKQKDIYKMRSELLSMKDSLRSDSDRKKYEKLYRSYKAELEWFNNELKDLELK